MKCNAVMYNVFVFGQAIQKLIHIKIVIINENKNNIG